MSSRPPGFFPDNVRYTAIPKIFLSDLLPKIDEVAELKITLYLFQALGDKRGYPRFVTYSELENAPMVLKGLAHLAAACGGSATDILRSGLDQAVLRGGFLRLKMQRAGKQEDLFLLNTPKNNRNMEKIIRGELPVHPDHTREPWQPQSLADQEENIFTRYENEVGMLTPAIAELLKDAESHYPSQWIMEAITEAAVHNARSWSYIEAILKTWEKEGRGDGKSRRDPEAPPDASRYYEGHYGEILKQRQRDR
ncbi:MAG: DnaD domain protein [Dehalococcoidia bacterium]|nr:DnaD domain protein [Dehalococcoidia bacterium]